MERRLSIFVQDDSSLIGGKIQPLAGDHRELTGRTKDGVAMTVKPPVVQKGNCYWLWAKTDTFGEVLFTRRGVCCMDFSQAGPKDCWSYHGKSEKQFEWKRVWAELGIQLQSLGRRWLACEAVVERSDWRVGPSPCSDSGVTLGGVCSHRAFLHDFIACCAPIRHTCAQCCASCCGVCASSLGKSIPGGLARGPACSGN